MSRVNLCLRVSIFVWFYREYNSESKSAIVSNFVPFRYYSCWSCWVVHYYCYFACSRSLKQPKELNFLDNLVENWINSRINPISAKTLKRILHLFGTKVWIFLIGLIFWGFGWYFLVISCWKSHNRAKVQKTVFLVISVNSNSKKFGGILVRGLEFPKKTRLLSNTDSFVVA